MARTQIDLKDLIWQRTDDQDRDRPAGYVGGLPDVSGTFSGTFDSEVVADLIGQDASLVPVDIDTHDKPNAAADLVPGQHIYLSLSDRRWSFEVDHVEPLSGNVVRAWCHLPVELTTASSS